MAEGNVGCGGVANGACRGAGEAGLLEAGGAIVGNFRGDADADGKAEGEGKAGTFGGEAKTGRFVGDTEGVWLVWDSKSRRGEEGGWLGQLGMAGDGAWNGWNELCSWDVPSSSSSSSPSFSWLLALDRAAGLTGELAARFLGL